MSNIYSDGQGTFLYLNKCEDDNNFVNLRIEEEQEDNDYAKVSISLYKDDIYNLSNQLKSIAHEDEKSIADDNLSEYIVTVEYFPFVVGKNKTFKVKTVLPKKELYDKILAEKESENEWFEVSVLVETINEYLADIPTITI